MSEKSWRVEVIADATGIFCRNALRLPTRQEAEDYAVALAKRWTKVTEWRLVQSEAPANYAFVDGELERLGQPDA
jgi:hypothetical protein